LDVLAKLRPAFGKSGTVTAGNASQISDGAAALVVASERFARESRSPLKARIVASATSGVAPKEIFIAPVTAVEKVLKKARMELSDIDLIELNEAFAAQSLAVLRDLGLDTVRVNPNGGAIGLGHPVAATGAILVTKLLNEMERQDHTLGLVSLCIGGGQGIAMLIARD
jgi:acetyl-CoA acetyltransferase family protein